MKIETSGYKIKIFDESDKDNNIYQEEIGSGLTAYGLKIFKDNILQHSILISANGGPTSSHQNSVLVVDNLIFLAIGNSIYCLSIPELDPRWTIGVDGASCFGIYYSETHKCLISHGELEISRVELDGKIRGQFSGRDIFSEGISIHKNHIEVTDFEKTTYSISIDTGKLLS